MEMYSPYCEICNQSSKLFFEEYSILKEEINLHNNGISSWDYLSHSQEENQKYDQTSHIARRNSIAAIVFQALAIESYLNLYGTYNLGDRFDRAFESKPTLVKLSLLCKEVTKKDFPKGDLYNNIGLLFKKRNSLVHYKAHSIDLKTSSDSEFEDYIYKHVAYAFSDIEKYIGLYDKLKKELKELEGVEYDIIEQQIINAQQELASAIIDMYLHNW